jgi:hypothetical protein
LIGDWWLLDCGMHSLSERAHCSSRRSMSERSFTPDSSNGSALCRIFEERERERESCTEQYGEGVNRASIHQTLCSVSSPFDGMNGLFHLSEIAFFLSFASKIVEEVRNVQNRCFNFCACGVGHVKYSRKNAILNHSDITRRSGLQESERNAHQVEEVG